MFIDKFIINLVIKNIMSDFAIVIGVIILIGLFIGAFIEQTSKHSKNNNTPTIVRILDKIQNFHFEKIRDEEILESQISIQLKSQGYDVKRQFKKEGLIVDLMVDNSIPIEIKIFEGKRDHMQRLLGQVDEYLDYYEKVGIIIYVSKKLDNELLNKFIQKLLNKKNVYLRKIIGEVERKISEKTYFLKEAK